MYYKAFKEANNRYEFCCLNNYVETILKIFISEIDKTITKLNNYKKEIDNINIPFKLSNSEKSIYIVLKEATILSGIGLSNNEIINDTGISNEL